MINVFRSNQQFPLIICATQIDFIIWVSTSLKIHKQAIAVIQCCFFLTCVINFVYKLYKILVCKVVQKTYTELNSQRKLQVWFGCCSFYEQLASAVSQIKLTHIINCIKKKVEFDKMFLYIAHTDTLVNY